VRVRTGVSIAIAALLTTGLAGCYAFPQTQRPYNPSDGISVTVGDVRLLNVLVFTEDGEDGNFSAAAVNTGDEDIDLTLQYVSDGEKVNIEIEIPVGETVEIGSGENGQVFLPAIDALPGTLLPIYFQYGSLPGKQATIPVLDASIEDYDGLLPTPTPTPTPTVTPTPTETPAG
jgi:hypothetical protein